MFYAGLLDLFHPPVVWHSVSHLKDDVSLSRKLSLFLELKQTLIINLKSRFEYSQIFILLCFAFFAVFIQFHFAKVELYFRKMGSRQQWSESKKLKKKKKKKMRRNLFLVDLKTSKRAILLKQCKFGGILIY